MQNTVDVQHNFLHVHLHMWFSSVVYLPPATNNWLMQWVRCILALVRSVLMWNAQNPMQRTGFLSYGFQGSAGSRDSLLPRGPDAPSPASSLHSQTTRRACRSLRWPPTLEAHSNKRIFLSGLLNFRLHVSTRFDETGVYIPWKPSKQRGWDALGVPLLAEAVKHMDLGFILS